MAASTDAPARSPEPAPADSRGGVGLVDRPWVRETAAATFVAVASVVIGVITLQLWKSGDLHVPRSIAGDNPLALSAIKSIEENGWYQFTPTLGWPFGQHLQDFAANGPDNLHFLMLKVLGLFASQVGLIDTAFALLSFALCGVAGYAALRWLGIRRLAAIVPAILFAVIPYHFIRQAIGHEFLAEYSSVPLGIYLAMAVLLGLPLFARREGARRLLRWSSWRTLGTLALCVYVASTGLYYCAFTLFLLATAGVAALVGRGELRRTILTVGTVGATILAVLVINQIPTLVYRHANGPNAVGGVRKPVESEVYAFKIAQFVIPPPEYRITKLGATGRAYSSQTLSPGEGSSFPGTLSLIGLGLVILAMTARLAGRPRGLLADRRLAAAAILAAAIFLLGTLGGIGAVLAWTIDSGLRAWTRMSVVLAFLGIFGLAVLIDRVQGRVHTRGGYRFLSAGLGVVLVLGVLDQTWPGMVPDYAGTRAEWGSDGRFVEAIENQLGGSGDIYQMPYMPYPESQPVNNMLDYSLIKGFLHSGPELRWSYGAMRGRPADWQEELSALPVEDQIRGAAAAGFDGIYVDKFGYTDPQGMLEQVQRVTGTAPIISENERLAFFDLRPYAARERAAAGAAGVARMRRETLYPVHVTWGPGFYDPETGNGETWRWAAAGATLGLDVPAGPSQAVRITGKLVAPRSAPVALTLNGKPLADLRATPRGTNFDEVVQLPPGTSTVGLTTTAPAVADAAGDTRDLHVQILDPVVGPADLTAPE